MIRLEALTEGWDLFPGALEIIRRLEKEEGGGHVKFDLPGAFAFIAQLNEYNAGKVVTIPLDVTAELGPKATGSLTVQSGHGWSITLGGTF